MPPTNARPVRALKQSSVVKRSIIVGGHKTSVSLEEPFWNELKTIALNEKMTVAKLVNKIDRTRAQGNLSSAIRVFVLHRVMRTDTAKIIPSEVSVDPTGSARA